jgi:hypothetical protein
MAATPPRPHGVDLLLLYVGVHAPGRTRKVALNACTVETVMLYTPFSRAQLAAKPREVFNLLGETSTHDVTYSGVPFKSRTHAPRISDADKKAILPSAVGAPDQVKLKLGGCDLLYWQESKSPEIWGQLLEDFDIEAVFDVSPGTGALLEAALRKGVRYVGVTTSDTHNAWLSNIADRIACCHVATPGRSLHSVDLGAAAKKHFQDVIDTLMVAAALDQEPSDDECPDEESL